MCNSVPVTGDLGNDNNDNYDNNDNNGNDHNDCWGLTIQQYARYRGLWFLDFCDCNNHNDCKES